MAQTITMQAPAIGLGPVVPSSLMPSGESYVINSAGQIQANPLDVGILLGFGFNIVNPNSLMVAAIAASGDGTKVLYGDGSFKTPGGGGGDAALLAISSGTITPGAAHFDITLPTAGYAYLKLSVINLVLTSGQAADDLAGAFSYDAGTTWLNDTVNGDSYLFATSAGTFINYPLLRMNGALDGVLQDTTQTNNGATTHLDLYNLTSSPWSRVVAGAYWFTTTTIDDSVAVLPDVNGDIAWVNKNSTVTPPATVPNKIRIQPYSDGTVGQTAKTFAQGTWTLAGVPFP